MRSAAHPCRDDLLARSRREPLSAVERRALDAHLGVCELCRAARAFAAALRRRSRSAGRRGRRADRAARGPDCRPRRGGGRRRRTAATRGRRRGGVAGRRGRRRGLGVGPRRRRRRRRTRRAPRRESPPGVARPRSARRSKRRPMKRRPVEAPPRRGAARCTMRRRHGGGAGSAARARGACPAARHRARPQPSCSPPPTRPGARATCEGRSIDTWRWSAASPTARRRWSRWSPPPICSRGWASRTARCAHSIDISPGVRTARSRPRRCSAAPGRSGSSGGASDEIDAWRRLLRAFPGSIYESAGRQRLDELLR